MKIDNIRLGFACNSSSTHSLVFLPSGRTVSDDYTPGYYGWECFTVASAEAKHDYLAMVFYEYLRRILERDLSVLVIKEMFGIEINQDHPHPIDHQSIPNIPLAWSGRGIDLDFWRDFSAFIRQERLVVLGGHDNDEDGEHPLLERGLKSAEFPNGIDSLNTWIARKDGEYWTLFSRRTGARLRFSFNPDAPVPPRALDLVDMKITDHCPFDCQYCYMGSSSGGTHAPYNTVLSYLLSLRQAKVFEVALGGGEPTLHPEFGRIVEEAAELGIVPNFTTRNLAWFRDPLNHCRILQSVGRIAFSTTNFHEASEAIALFEAHHLPKRKLAFQVIDGLIAPGVLEGIMKLASLHAIPVIILGYKVSGRGKDYPPVTSYQGKWLNVVKALRERDRLPPVGVDTLIIQQYSEQIRQQDVPELFYDDREGIYSMYIDAVQREAGISSYDGETQSCEPMKVKDVFDGLPIA
jgi:hypothetical protein